MRNKKLLFLLLLSIFGKNMFVISRAEDGLKPIDSITSIKPISKVLVKKEVDLEAKPLEVNLADKSKEVNLIDKSKEVKLVVKPLEKPNKLTSITKQVSLLDILQNNIKKNDKKFIKMVSGQITVGSFDSSSKNTHEKVFDVEKLYKNFRNIDVDILALQNVDFFNLRMSEDVPNTLQNLSKMKYKSFLETYDYSYGDKGSLILSKYPIIKEESFDLTSINEIKDENLKKEYLEAFEKFVGQKSDLYLNKIKDLEQKFNEKGYMFDLPKKLQKVEIEYNDQAISVYNVDLSNKFDKLRDIQFNEVLEILRKDSNSQIILLGNILNSFKTILPTNNQNDDTFLINDFERIDQDWQLSKDLSNIVNYPLVFVKKDMLTIDGKEMVSIDDNFFEKKLSKWTLTLQRN